jgi:hypothetical protein
VEERLERRRGRRGTKPIAAFDPLIFSNFSSSNPPLKLADNNTRSVA